MKKRIYIDLLFILLLGLLPTLWFSNGTLLLGHDAGMAIDPVTHFLDRIYVWSQRFDIGTDQNGALLGAFFIHSFEAFLAWIGLSLRTGQIVQFIFWFTMPGLAMYFFAYKMFSSKRYLPLIASVIYMLNFYLLQGWFIAERTKFSIYIAFPLVLYILIEYLWGKMKFLPAIIWTGVVLGIFNGGGSLPLYGGLIMSILIVFLYINLINKDAKTIIKTILYSLGSSITYLLFNAYWVIPYFFYVSGFYNRDLAQAGGTEGALSWARYLSSQTTFMHLFRGQGIPDWYLNPYHAYSQIFLKQPLLILISFLFPILAFGSLLLLKTKREQYLTYLLVFICLVGMLFSAGPGSQFGFIYEFMVTYIPGFAMFRSAFFKFDYMVWFSYGILIGLTIDFLFSKLEQKYFRNYSFIFSTVALLVFIFGYTLYHFPVLNGSFLDYSREPGKELTTRVKLPNYIVDFGKWVNTQDINTRFLVMPQLGNTTYSSYTWYYWSLAPVTSLLTRNSFVHNTALVPENEKILMEEMYGAFLRGDMGSFADFTKVFAIDSIVVQNDYDWQNSTWGTVNPAIYESILKAHPDLFIHEKTFGKWDVYKIAERQKSLRINTSTKLSFLQGKLGKVVSFPYFEPKSPLFMSDVEGKNIDYYANNATDIFLAPECIQCDLEYKGVTFQYYNPKVLPGSIFYPFVKFRENQVKKASHDFSSLVNLYITITNRRIIEVKWMVDSRKRIEQILPNIERYKKAMNEFIAVLEQKDSAVVEDSAAQMVMENIVHQVSLVDSIYDEPLLSFFQRDALARTYDLIVKVEKLASDKMWVTENMEDKKYIYDLPLIGSYDIYVKKGSLTSPESDSSNTTISFRDLPMVLKPISTVGDWLYFGSVNFNSKKVYIDLKDGTMANMINSVDPAFPDRKDGIIQDNNNFIYTTNAMNKCFYYQFHGLDYLNTQYVVSFSYRNFSDKNKLSFFHSFEGDDLVKYSVKDSSLASTRYFSKFTKLITPKNGNIRLNFCNGFLSLSELNRFEKQLDPDVLPDKKQLIEIKDISFNKVAYPNIVLYRQQRQVKDLDTVDSFSKKDPVTYNINLKNTNQPISLIMRESFGKYWRLCDENNKCLSFDDKSHFSNAGFTNAWYLKNAGLGSKLTLYYYPQKWYALGTKVTFISIGIILGFICIRFLKRK
ncbi:hypothetical protein HZA75_01810 [Candidatus Roizmanbacteria bacterium]|nr:hypothetical protein [Candidatus Roizmanbacteria bacterium]